MSNTLRPGDDGFVDTRTEAEIDEMYRRSYEADDSGPKPEWWNSPNMTWAIVLGLLAIIGFGLWGMVH